MIFFLWIILGAINGLFWAFVFADPTISVEKTWNQMPLKTLLICLALGIITGLLGVFFTLFVVGCVLWTMLLKAIEGKTIGDLRK